MIDPNKLAPPAPRLKPADLGGNNVAIVTIATADQTVRKGENLLQMSFEEFPGFHWYPNLTSIRRLVDGLGPNEKEWPGKKAVLEVVKTNDPDKKRQVDSLWAAEADTWEAHFKAIAKRLEAAKRRGNEQSKKDGKKKGSK